MISMTLAGIRILKDNSIECQSWSGFPGKILKLIFNSKVSLNIFLELDKAPNPSFNMELISPEESQTQNNYP